MASVERTTDAGTGAQRPRSGARSWRADLGTGENVHPAPASLAPVNGDQNRSVNSRAPRRRTAGRDRPPWPPSQTVRGRVLMKVGSERAKWSLRSCTSARRRMTISSHRQSPWAVTPSGHRCLAATIEQMFRALDESAARLLAEVDHERRRSERDLRSSCSRTAST
jgi:hypothetical protein